jgi:hypothetical protein
MKHEEDAAVLPVLERPQERLHELRSERLAPPLRQPRVRYTLGRVRPQALRDQRPLEELVQDHEVTAHAVRAVRLQHRALVGDDVARLDLGQWPPPERVVQPRDDAAVRVHRARLPRLLDLGRREPLGDRGLERERRRFPPPLVDVGDAGAAELRRFRAGHAVTLGAGGLHDLLAVRVAVLDPKDAAAGAVVDDDAVASLLTHRRPPTLRAAPARSAPGRTSEPGA